MTSPRCLALATALLLCLSAAPAAAAAPQPPTIDRLSLPEMAADTRHAHKRHHQERGADGAGNSH